MSEDKQVSSGKPKVALIDLIATLEQRILAVIIDGLIVDLIFIIVLLIPTILQILAIINMNPILELLSTVAWAISVPLAILASFFYFVYWPIKTKGFTIGMRKIGIRFFVIPDIKNKKIRPLAKEDFLLSIKRTLFSFVDLLAFGIVGIIIINKSPTNQCFSEKLLDIIVIEQEIDEF
ncbi:MAG: hypothetical protein EAX90_02745 [Candidatus Heimdallarchaeota archaeon]|nr:hypothetical protein [Candidatus Heimdallarchaeota archaeon]